jgi:hypothetical protein
MKSTITTPFLSQKTAVGYLADKVTLNFPDLFGECVYIHCFDCSLVSAFTNETQVSSPVTLHCDRETHRHLCGVAPKIKSKT